MTKALPMTSVETMRTNARKHIERGAVTADYRADLKVVLSHLNDALATELICVLRYRRHHFMSKGILAPAVAAEFLNHSNQELGHADLLAERIVQLGGAPDFAPSGLVDRSHAEYIEGSSLQDRIHENLVAERIAVNSYRDLIAYLGTDDPTTSEMLKTILAVEEKHANELADLLQYFPRS